MRVSSFLAFAVLVVGCARAAVSTPDDRTRALQGKWEQSCHQGASGAYRHSTLSVSQRGTEVRLSRFDGPTCEGPHLAVVMSGLFTDGRQDASSSGGGFEVDTELERFEATLSSDALAGQASEELLFGLDDWEANVSRSLFGALAVADGSPMLYEGDVATTLFRVEPGRLFARALGGPWLPQGESLLSTGAPFVKLSH